MRHAMLITAYQNFDCLYDMLKVYSERMDFDCYVHIDKKAVISKDMLEKLKSVKNVDIVSKYRINWGSYKHPMAYIHLLKMAKKKQDYDFYHFISANTFIGVAKDKFNDFFEKNKDKFFMEFINFKGTASEKDLKEWYLYYHYPFLYNKRGKNGRFWDNVEFYGIKIQKKLGIKRNVDFTFKGYVYCHLNNKAAEYVLENYKKYVNKIKYCHVGEEFFFQNILLNSEYYNEVINDSLIYDDWSEERERPAIINKDDVENFKKTDKIFIRKVESSEMVKYILENMK